jgi:hypothetical protein
VWVCVCGVLRAQQRTQPVGIAHCPLRSVGLSRRRRGARRRGRTRRAGPTPATVRGQRGVSGPSSRASHHHRTLPGCLAARWRKGSRALWCERRRARCVARRQRRIPRVCLTRASQGAVVRRSAGAGGLQRSAGAGEVCCGRPKPPVSGIGSAVAQLWRALAAAASADDGELAVVELQRPAELLLDA